MSGFRNSVPIWKCDQAKHSCDHVYVHFIPFSSSPLCMSARRSKSPSKQPRLRNKSKKDKEANEGEEDMPQRPMAVTSGLNAIHIAPRTPKTSKTQRNVVDEENTQEMELSLLDEEERKQAARGLGETEEQGYVSEPDAKRSLSSKDQRGLVLLIVLCEL